MLRSYIVGLWVVIVGLTPAFADWPEFRGPLGQGSATSKQIAHVPLKWSATENVRWRTPLAGNGWSSPIVVGERIYLTTAAALDSNDPKSDLDLSLLIVDVRTGEMIKDVKLFRQSGANAPGIHKKNSHASPTPICRDERIYVHFGHQGTACVSTAGDIIWKNDGLDYPPVHGNGGSPIVVDDLLIFSCDGGEAGEVIALDTYTGNVRWRTPRDVEATKKFSFSTPLLINPDGRRQLIIPGSNVVQSLDPATGKEHWRVRYDGFSVVPRPIFSEGLVFVCTGYSTPSLLAIRPDGSGDVTQSHLVWKTNLSVPNTPSLVAHDGQVTMVSDKGIAVSLEAKTGKEIWKARIGGNFSSSPLLVGDRIYLLSEEGECTVIAAAREFRELSKNKMSERTLASLAMVENDLLLRTADALYRIGQ